MCFWSVSSDHLYVVQSKNTSLQLSQMGLKVHEKSVNSDKDRKSSIVYRKKVECHPLAVIIMETTKGKYPSFTGRHPNCVNTFDLNWVWTMFTGPYTNFSRSSPKSIIEPWIVWFGSECITYKRLSNIQGASKSIKVEKNIVRLINSFDSNEKQSYSVSHPDSSSFNNYGTFVVICRIRINHTYKIIGIGRNYRVATSIHIQDFSRKLKSNNTP